MFDLPSENICFTNKERATERIGSLLVKQIFSLGKSNKVAGCVIQNGKLSKYDKIKISRDGKQLYFGLIASLKVGKSSVELVEGEGAECGISFQDNFSDISVGDIIESFMQS